MLYLAFFPLYLTHFSSVDLSERGKKVMFLKSEKISKKIKNAIISGIFVLYIWFIYFSFVWYHSL